MWKKPSSGPVDLEIEYSSRSARDKPCSVRAHQAKGAGGNEFQLGRARANVFSRLSQTHPHPPTPEGSGHAGPRSPPLPLGDACRDRKGELSGTRLKWPEEEASWPLI
ncbi:unnamed protein product [Pleuronectes platessa]|uniref:Uncharacterized protein n=1 Tax=Pleuronectes platessa TaxID=8262 RepID=A0A9N7YN87_PLEPL|nr:unnamed protein product [Pleuronectes platessa]